MDRMDKMDKMDKMLLVRREMLFGRANALERAKAPWCGKQRLLVSALGADYGVGTCRQYGCPWLRPANKPYKPYKPYKPRASWCGERRCLVSAFGADYGVVPSVCQSPGV